MKRDLLVVVLGLAATVAVIAYGHGRSRRAPVAPAARLEQASLKVGGMKCSSCSDRIAHAVMQLQGVRDVHVDLGRDLVSVRFDAARVRADQIREAITHAGFPVRPAQR